MTFNIDVVVAGAGEPYREFFTPAPAQTVFALANSAALPAAGVAILNQFEYAEGAPGGGYFTIVGTTFTWTGPEVLNPTDSLAVIYK